MAQKRVVVVGAGAAGLMATIHAADAGAQVLLLEGTRDGGRKILISGGGRCNVLPSELQPGRFVTASSPNSLRRLLLSWSLSQQREFFEGRLGTPLALEEETGKLFPVSNRARDIRDALVRRALELGAEIRFESRVSGLDDLGTDASGHRWRVRLDGHPPVDGAAVILATGGLSVPTTGSDGAGLRIAREMGHTINPTYPALTPLTASPPRHSPLAGVSLPVRLEAPLAKGFIATEGGFLFTHRGYSGPAVLDISHLAVRARLQSEPQPIYVQWTELDRDAWDRRLREAGTGEVGPLLRRHLPQRLADTLLEECDVASATPLAHLRRDSRTRLVEALARYPLPWTGDEGYKKAEVTGGGVALGEVDPHTLQSRLRPGLFLCGELLDAFGPIGGHNFAWAWATGRTAGLGAAGGVKR
jgi:predicted Rossmann fold flavoprotein